MSWGFVFLLSHLLWLSLLLRLFCLLYLGSFLIHDFSFFRLFRLLVLHFLRILGLLHTDLSIRHGCLIRCVLSEDGNVLFDSLEIRFVPL